MVDVSRAVADEGRLSALRRSHLLDSRPEAAFDRLTGLASRVLRAPMALISLVDEGRQFFKSAVGLPEPWASLRETPLSHSFCQHVVASRCVLAVADAGSDPLVRENLAVAELGVIAYLGVPLLSACGHALGAFCVIDLRPRPWTDEEVAILRDLAASVMTEIELREDVARRVGVEDQLREVARAFQEANDELTTAYDATIEGWSRALDLRDRETEGHCRRVTEMTLRLAGAAGIGPGELRDVRWGAQLHDIGKLGIPDAILHKPGPLTEPEWAVMRRHPGYAYEWLSPIPFLGAALEIPHCHHERWDGTGYPRGLKGEEIPLSARVFAVADVWDALASDRPYRRAWPEGRIRDHVRSQSGSHFDPDIVRAFLGPRSGPHRMPGLARPAPPTLVRGGRAACSLRASDGETRAVGRGDHRDFRGGCRPDLSGGPGIMERRPSPPRG